MAITIESQPNAVHPVNSPTIVVCSSTNVAKPKFRFKINVDVGGVDVGTWFITPDPNDFGVFDIAPRIRKLIRADIDDGSAYPNTLSIIDNPADKLFMYGQDGLKDITIEVQESFAADEDSIPVNQGAVTSFSFKGFPGSTLIGDGLNFSPKNGQLNSQTRQTLNVITDGRFLQETYLDIYLTDDDHFLLTHFGAIGDGLLPRYWRYQMYFDNTSFASQDLEISPNSWGSGTNEMIYFNCGPRDLSGSSIVVSNTRPTPGSLWNRYTLQAISSGNVEVSAIYTIHRVREYCQFDNVQLMFTNKFGFWNFATFHLKSKRGVNVNRAKQFKTPVGQTTGAGYSFNKWDREVEEYGKEPTVELTLNTGFLNKAQANDLESHLYSTDVRMMLNGSSTPVPVVITSRKFMNDKFEKLRQYEVKIEVAQSYYQA